VDILGDFDYVQVHSHVAVNVCLHFRAKDSAALVDLHISFATLCDEISNVPRKLHFLLVFNYFFPFLAIGHSQELNHKLAGFQLLRSTHRLEKSLKLFLSFKQRFLYQLWRSSRQWRHEDVRKLVAKEPSCDKEIFILSEDFLFVHSLYVSLNTVLGIVTREKTSFLDFI